jgi:hypothetical protein
LEDAVSAYPTDTFLLYQLMCESWIDNDVEKAQKYFHEWHNKV